MKKLGIRNRLEENETIYYITIEGIELMFPTQSEADNVLQAIITYLRHNGGIAKGNERRRILSLLYANNLQEAANLIKSEVL